jgi:sugar/nucleoside kinase (ribokinase family)
MVVPFDILGLGCVAVDDLVYVASYPPADAKVAVLRRERQCGGTTATALVAASRLGSPCAYAGTLGEDPLSAFVVQHLSQENVDISLIRRRPGARPIYCTILVEEARPTRTIFYDLNGVLGAQPDWPDDAVIRAVRVLCVDHFGIEGMSRAARVARASRVPIVADFESDQGPGFSDLLALIDHLIVSDTFALYLTGATTPAEAAKRLWTNERRAVIVTCGADGCWFLDAATRDQPRHQPAFVVPVVDTTGCGDVFHGAYASALARGLDLVSRVRFATGAASLKATQSGAQAGIPTRAAVEALLTKSNG